MIGFRFCVITDRQRCAPRSLEDVVRDACEAGVRAVQLREKDLALEERVALARRLRAVTRETGAALIVNRGEDDAAFRWALRDADGVHLPDGPNLAREVGRLGDRPGGILLGASTHSRERALEAAALGVDYVIFGPVFETPSKSRFGPPQGLDALAAACDACTVPVIAVGGITPGNAASCVRAGAHGVAAIGAVLGAGDVGAAVRRFAIALEGL